MFYRLACYLWAKCLFHDYVPQPVNFAAVSAWLDQFSGADQKYLFTLLRHVTYISQKQTLRALCELNRGLLKKLAADGIPHKKVIYIQVDDAGSSSHWALALLKHTERLENLGCTFLDSKNIRGLNEATTKLESGAIVYVDDFAGTGDQFCRSRDFVAEHIVGNFSEFFLLPCICEEAVQQLNERGVEPTALHVHAKKNRLLHPEGNLCPPHVKTRLLELADQVNPKHALGYRSLASMVVFSRNCPTSVPYLLRGSKNQKPFSGILPRTTDLPPVQHYQAGAAATDGATAAEP
jgi:hypothetical protein